MKGEVTELVLLFVFYKANTLPLAIPPLKFFFSCGQTKQKQKICLKSQSRWVPEFPTCFESVKTHCQQGEGYFPLLWQMAKSTLNFRGGMCIISGQLPQASVASLMHATCSMVSAGHTVTGICVKHTILCYDPLCPLQALQCQCTSSAGLAGLIS